jgi:hypothetical protein
VRNDYNIVGSYNNQRYSNIDSERTVNMFEYIDKDSKKPKTLISTSGIINTGLNFDPETQGFRASFVFKNQSYHVIGSSIFLINPDFSYAKIGTLNTSAGYVGIDANTFQVIFVDGTNGWIWDTNSLIFEQITDPAFPLFPIDVCMLDNFFVAASGGTNNFLLSSFNQGLVWSGTSNNFTVTIASNLITLLNGNTNSYQTGVPVMFTTTGTLPAPLVIDTTYIVTKVSSTTLRISLNGVPVVFTTTGAGVQTIENFGQLQQGSITSHPGNIVACRTLHRRLFLFSENFIEPWENAGIGTNLPFRRINSMLMEVGTPAIGSISVGFDRLFFLSQDKDGLSSVMEVTGTQTVPVSNRALDFQLAQYASDPNLGVSDSRGILIKENGLIFYRLNFTKANHTFVLNVSMSGSEDLKWHEEEILNGDRHPAQTHAYFNGNNYYGHFALPILYLVDPNIPNNDGESIRRMRIGAPLMDESGKRIRVNRFPLDLIQGIPELVNSDSIVLLTEDGLSFLETEDGIPILVSSGNVSPSLENPKVYLSISKDGGQTYSFKQVALMGKVGERTYRTIWRKLPISARNQAFIPKIEFFNQIPFVILGAVWDFEVLPE